MRLLPPDRHPAVVSRSSPSRRFGAVVLGTLAVGFAFGCGSKFDLPTEHPAAQIPSDQSYAMVATWFGMTGIQDILLTQGTGTQLFVLLNRGGSSTAPRGEVLSYARFSRTGVPTPVGGVAPFVSLFNPMAIASGGDGLGRSNNRVFVLDQGDTCIARLNTVTSRCDTVPPGARYRVNDLEHYWRVREYRLTGGDTVSTFSDTSMAWVQGIAADSLGRVYVSGLAIVLVPRQDNPSIVTRSHLWRIYRYERGPRPIGGQDPYMPGSNWHRDLTWEVQEGTGTGFVIDPRGVFWTSDQSGVILAADFRKDAVQKLSAQTSNIGFLRIDGTESDLRLNGPTDVAGDLQGYIYIADAGNARVLRYDGLGNFAQRVDIEANANGLPLRNPVTVAVDDSLVFVGDAVAGEVIRYQRRR